MTREERREFITSLCDSLKADILSKADKMPDDWDGHELRQYIADKAQEIVWTRMSRSRKQRYNNECLVRNL